MYLALIFTFKLILFIIKPVLSLDCTVNQKTRLGELRRHLLCDYDKSIRPVLDMNKSIIVSVRMHVKSHDFDEHNQRLTIYCWLPLSWTDEHLKWEPEQWDGIKDFLVGSLEIWTPDISLYNSDNGQNIASHDEVNCEVESTGKMSCVLPIEFTAHCKPNYVRWPYDAQNCTLYFGSWMSPGEHIDYDNKTLKAEISEAQPNPTWNLVKATTKRVSKTYSCCPNQTFPTLYFNFKIERHSGVMEVLFLFPAFFLIVINLIVLVINTKNTNRLLLLSLNIMSHILFLQQLSWYIPNNGDTVPNVLLFFRDSMMLTCLVLVESVIVQGLENCQLGVPFWIDNSLKKVSGNKVGNLVFFHVPYEKKIDEETNDDGTILVSPVKPQEVTIWLMFAKLLDRLLFIVLFFMYFIMFWGLLPSGY